MLILRWLAAQAMKGREILSLILVVAASLWLSSANREDQHHFRVALTGTVLYPLQLVVDKLHFRLDLAREMAKVRMENARLITENAKLTELAEIRNSLLEFEPVRSRLEFPLVAGRVVSRDPLRLGGLWILDIGSESGVKEGMAVISSIGLVGRIISSGSDHAQMQTLADPDCRVAVLSTRSRNPGILHSTDGSGVFVEFSVTSDIRPGDTLVTWGAGGVFPRGLPVGLVSQVRRTPTNVLRNARVVPFQDPWEVRDVFVLLRPPEYKVLPDSSVFTATKAWK